MSITVEGQLGLEKHVMFQLLDEHNCYRSEHSNNVCCRSIFAYDSTGFLARSAKFFSDGVKVSIQTMSESGRQAITKSASLQEVASRGVGLANESKVHEVIFFK